MILTVFGYHCQKDLDRGRLQFRVYHEESSIRIRGDHLLSAHSLDNKFESGRSLTTCTTDMELQKQKSRAERNAKMLTNTLSVKCPRISQSQRRLGVKKSLSEGHTWVPVRKGLKYLGM